MSYTAIENTPIQVDLTQACNYTGWTIDGTIATHSSCQSGYITLKSYPITQGNSYQISYQVLSVSGGYVQPFIGTNGGAQRTTSGIYVETITAAANGFVTFFSNANCQISAFNTANVTDTTGTTIVYSKTNKKWSDYRDYYPDFLWSLYTTTLVGNNGQLYVAQNGGGTNTNNFFGTQYQSTIKFVEAKNPGIVKDYETISYQANMLLVSTINGIVSSLGQITTLIDTDFIKQKLQSNGQSVIIYQNDNVYSASFLNDENSDIVNGEQMRGNYLIVELTTVDGSTPLILFSVSVKNKLVFLGSRP